MADFNLDSIDDIDMNYDFGFTTVDETEVQQFEKEVSDAVAKATKDETGALESKLDNIKSSIQMLISSRDEDRDGFEKEISDAVAKITPQWEANLDNIKASIQTLVSYRDEDRVIYTDGFEKEISDAVAKTMTQDTDALKAKIDNIEASIQALISYRDEDKNELKNKGEAMNETYKNQMKNLEKLILPLLYNLLKNPSDEYIKWPNRTNVVQAQINKIVAITRAVQ